MIDASIAKLVGAAPEQQVREDLRRFKQLMETAEIARSEASLPRAHAAQPPAEISKVYAGKA